MKTLSTHDTSLLKSNLAALYGERSDFQLSRYVAILSKFCAMFGKNSACFVSSPGRVEVCGNHTDHNGGRVISCAVNLDTVAAFCPDDSGVINIYSEGYGKIEVNLSGSEKAPKGTPAALVQGVCEGLVDAGYKVGGFNAYMQSDVLGGAGISSSASFELLICEIENAVYNSGTVPDEGKAKIAQRAESVYYGKPCGLLDQSAVAYGGLNVFDFATPGSVGAKRIKNTLADYALVLINAGGSHENLTDEYAAIPAEMFEIAEAFGKKRLIEVEESAFFAKESELKSAHSLRSVLRAKHFFNENRRVDALAAAIENRDFDFALHLINESGESSMNLLQNCYVEGVAERPLVEALQRAKAALPFGATRVHGGGFAGTVLNVVPKSSLLVFVDEMSKFYSEKDILTLTVRDCGAFVF